MCVYIKRGVSLNLHHFLLRAQGGSNWNKENITEVQFRKLLRERIDTVDLRRAKEDIVRFIKGPKVLDIWSPKYFHDLVQQLKVVQEEGF